MRDLAGKVAVVTGAASGVGLALARRFGTEGMRVVLADVEPAALEAAAAALADEGLDVLAVPTDVSDRGAVEALADRTREAFGPWHVVCNNAGVQRRGPYAWEASAEEWEWMLGVNLGGVVNGIRTFLPDLVARGEGHVVNTCSAAGIVGIPHIAPYSASKHAVIGLSTAIHRELREAGSPVRISVLLPGGAIRSAMGTAERNWPAHFGALPPLADHARAYNEARLATKAADGQDPAGLADLVVDAIRAERFWVFASSQYLGRWADDVQAALAGEDPVPFSV